MGCYETGNEQQNLAVAEARILEQILPLFASLLKYGLNR